jgi:hypothetical protein
MAKGTKAKATRPLFLVGEANGRSGSATVKVGEMRSSIGAYEANDVVYAVLTSKNARYLSLTVTINARSREQLDALYSELSKHPMVMMVL